MWMTNLGLIVKPYVIPSIQDQRNKLYGNYTSRFLSIALQIFNLSECQKLLLDNNFD